MIDLGLQKLAKDSGGLADTPTYVQVQVLLKNNNILC